MTVRVQKLFNKFMSFSPSTSSPGIHTIHLTKGLVKSCGFTCVEGCRITMSVKGSFNLASKKFGIQELATFNLSIFHVHPSPQSQRFSSLSQNCREQMHRLKWKHPVADLVASTHLGETFSPTSYGKAVMGCQKNCLRAMIMGPCIKDIPRRLQEQNHIVPFLFDPCQCE